MRNGHQVLHYLLLGAQSFGIHHDQFALMTTAEMGKEVKAKAHEPVLVGNHDHRHLLDTACVQLV